jgi:hypothetical protein
MPAGPTEQRSPVLTLAVWATIAGSGGVGLQLPFYIFPCCFS